MRMRRRDRGLTLIEILLALIIMVLGIVGILALFPPALDSAKISMEETQGAVLGESVANAITTGARFAVPNGTSGSYRMLVTHDSINSGSGQLVYYQFDLPTLATSGTTAAPNWYHHPAPVSPGMGTPVAASLEQLSDFRLTGDPWTHAQFDSIKGTSATTGTDGSEPLNQFVYSFDVRKINTLEYLMLPPPSGQSLTLAQLDPLVRCWEFRIHTFRMASSGSVGGTVAGAGWTAKKWVATMTARITVR